MIEVIYKEEKQEAKGNEGMFAIPRNIRQIGLSGEDYKIYVEDYVYTFLVRLAGMDTEGEKEKGHLAVLTGEAKWQAGVTYVFVRGALTVEKTEAAADHIDFTDAVWKKLYDEQELYFPGQEIVGWFFAQQELPLEITEVFKRVHLKHFGGGEKVLMLMDPAEREDAFFRYENSFLVRQPGYYLFYEKNPLMQNYMLDKNQEVIPEKTEEVPDEAVVAFRKIIHSKKRTKREEKQEKAADAGDFVQEERPSVFSYAATACLAIAVLAVGVNFYQNYQTFPEEVQEVRTASAPAEEAAPTTTVTPGVSGTTAPSVTAAATPGTDRTGTSLIGESIEEAKAKRAALAGTEQENADSDEADETEQEAAATAEADETEQGTAATAETDEADQGSAASDETGNSSVQEDSEIFKEESDVRKALRRQALEETEKTEGEAEAGQETENTAQLSGEADAAASSGTAHTSYVIRPGDTLYQISMEKYGNMDAISEICRLNGISQEEIIYPGQIIVLP